MVRWDVLIFGLTADMRDMMIKGNPLTLPQANPGCLQPLEHAELAATYVAAHKEGCTRADAEGALSAFSCPAAALDECVTSALIEERDGLLRATANASGDGGARRTASWADARRDFAFRALGMTAGAVNGPRIQRDLAAAALRQLYGLDNLPALPSRAEARCELLRRIVACFGEPFAAPVPRPAGAFSFDSMSRSLYLAFAGLGGGTVLQADAALLSSAFGGPAATLADLSATIIGAALKTQVQKAEKREEVFDLDGFSESVRKLAMRLETKPYAGRVAIAQVYDAGLAQGLNLGTLDEFKSHLAEAAREGLLDLERYDIAGPFEASLKERSRLRFGRDERHFIVNQWI